MGTRKGRSFSIWHQAFQVGPFAYPQTPGQTSSSDCSENLYPEQSEVQGLRGARAVPKPNSGSLRLSGWGRWEAVVLGFNSAATKRKNEVKRSSGIRPSYETRGPFLVPNQRVFPLLLLHREPPTHISKSRWPYPQIRLLLSTTALVQTTITSCWADIQAFNFVSFPSSALYTFFFTQHPAGYFWNEIRLCRSPN